jgi:hypothetical protein
MRKSAKLRLTVNSFSESLAGKSNLNPLSCQLHVSVMAGKPTYIGAIVTEALVFRTHLGDERNGSPSRHILTQPGEYLAPTDIQAG